MSSVLPRDIEGVFFELDLHCVMAFDFRESRGVIKSISISTYKDTFDFCVETYGDIYSLAISKKLSILLKSKDNTFYVNHGKFSDFFSGMKSEINAKIVNLKGERDLSCRELFNAGMNVEESYLQ